MGIKGKDMLLDYRNDTRVFSGNAMFDMTPKLNAFIVLESNENVVSVFVQGAKTVTLECMLEVSAEDIFKEILLYAKYDKETNPEKFV